MRTQIKLIVIVVLIILSACSNTGTPQSYGPKAAVSMQVFYDQLSPHGMWVNYSPYGYVWVPNVGWGFSPYATSGNWVFTSYGWTWHSYYSWGWAPFHYGRWFYDSMYGWMWVPDTVWGPAWVVWSTGGGYCGWAPLAPKVSVSVAISGGYIVPRDQWVFVPEKNLSHRNIGRYRVDQSKNRALLEKALLVRHMREQNNVTYVPGPDRNTIQKAMKKPITPVAIRERNRPGNGRLKRDELEIFKPNVQRENALHTRNFPHRPNRVYELNDVRDRNEGWYRPNPRNREYYENQQQRVHPKEEKNRGNILRGNSGKSGKSGKKDN
jgi:hypothetical protein